MQSKITTCSSLKLNINSIQNKSIFAKEFYFKNNENRLVLIGDGTYLYCQEKFQQRVSAKIV
jgi:hypothetical protein